ncbi:DNA repair protein RecO [Candidatus Saccharibacteria bacterium]|nr:DNA repair protein RecO [Candidatus Saccharibacteria bacterium]
MSTNTSNKDIRTLGYVIRRTNYGEADRILSIITPFGKKTVIAKSVRKSKSKLAGSIELFSLIDFNIHQGKSEFGIVTGAKMLKFNGNILKDMARMELAGVIFKEISRLAESSDNAEFYEITDQCLKGLDDGTDLRLVETWFWLNIDRASGEEVNLYRDSNGKLLQEDRQYDYNGQEETFFEHEDGEYGANEIKMLRLCYKAKLGVVKKVKIDDALLMKILFFARTLNNV